MRLETGSIYRNEGSYFYVDEYLKALTKQFVIWNNDKFVVLETFSFPWYRVMYKIIYNGKVGYLDDVFVDMVGNRLKRIY